MAQADKTFTGGCHCQHIKYEVTLTSEQLAKPEAAKCNCTWCQKRGVVLYSISSSNFRLISPKDKSEMSSYEPKGPEMHRWFCGKCGCHVYTEGEYEAFGAKHDAFSINLLTLDQPQDGLDLSKFKVGYIDGKHDNWMAGLQDTPWPEGCQ